MCVAVSDVFLFVLLTFRLISLHLSKNLFAGLFCSGKKKAHKHIIVGPVALGTTPGMSQGQTLVFSLFYTMEVSLYLGQTQFVPGTISGTKGGTKSWCVKSLCAFFARCLCQGCENGVFGKRCFCPLPKTGGFDEKWRKWRFTFYPQKQGVALLGAQKPTKMTKMAGVPQTKPGFSKSRVFAALIVVFGDHFEIIPVLLIDVACMRGACELRICAHSTFVAH